LYIMARLYCPRNRLISLALAAFAICLTGFDQPDYEKHCLEGRRHLQEKNQEEALKAFSQAQQIDPRRPLAYIGEAMASRATKQLDRAVRAAERAMDCQPTDEELVTALVIRGSAYHAQKQYEPAKVDFEKAIKLAPDHAAAHSELGRLYVDLKNETRALQHFDEALKANPEDDQTYVARGKLHRKSGDLAKAARDFERAVDLQKGLPAYQFLLGQVRFENREYEASLKAANEAIDLNKQFWAAYVLKGASLYKLEQYEQAEQCLAEATRMVTIDAGAWLWLGKTRLQLGKVDQAIEDIEEIFKFDTKYVAAYRALADAYETVAEDPEKTTQFRQAAQECRETAGKLEDELRKAAALGPDFRHDTAPSRLGTTAKFDPATIAAEVLEGRVPPADMITRQVEAEAEKRRQQLAPWLNDLKLCEAKSVVPEACEAIESNLSASDERFKLKEFEYAAYGFEQVQALCQAALNEFNEVAGSDDELWLNWARQRAGRNVPDDEKIIVWAAIAEASHLCHDEKGYESAMQKVVSQVKAAGMTSPLTGAVNLLSLAEVQIRCGDQVGARSSAASAAAYSNAISDAGPRSSWLARSAGLLVRLGDGDAWSKYIPQALALAAQIGNRNDTRERKWHPIYVKCVAYAEAGALEQAFDAAAELELVEPKAYRPALADRAAPAYAAIALAAARSGLRDPSHKLVFERCYAAACAHLATLFDSDRRIKTFTRKLLASADAEAGNNTRAWVAAANIPDPNARAVSLIRIMQREVSESRFARALAWAQYLPTDARISNGSLWIAMAKVRSFSDSFVSHKKWADEPRNDAERAIRFAGVAAGISTTTEEDVKRASVRVEEAVYDKGTGILDLLAAALELKQPSTAKGGTYDSTAAADSLWWLQQAVTAAEAVEDPILRARVVFQLARACHAIGDEEKLSTCTTILISGLLTPAFNGLKLRKSTRSWICCSTSRSSRMTSA
jgi:tetratricopeptide (TPR) repeat protein